MSFSGTHDQNYRKEAGLLCLFLVSPLKAYMLSVDARLHETVLRPSREVLCVML